MTVPVAISRGNEAIAEAVRRAAVPDREVDFICECADSDCLGRVPLTLESYERIRARDEAVTLPNHSAFEAAQ